MMSGTTKIIMNRMTDSTSVPMTAGYIMILRALAISSSCHFSVSTMSTSTTFMRPLRSPTLIRLTNTLSKIFGYSASACENELPPSIASIRPVMTSRKVGFSSPSRRSARPSRIGTPARVSCSR